MRIRRRPQAQAQAPIPSPLLRPASDPSTAPSQPPPPPSPQPHWLSQEEEEVEVDAGEKSKSGELHRPNADLGDEPSRSRQAQPQGNNVVGGRSGSQNTPGRGAQRQGAADGHGSIENGHRDWPLISAGEERVVSVSMPVMPPTAAVHGKQGIKSDGPKRRRSPAVLLEGSRCSRVNGRGWRCSQPTLVGYSLCEHHLGKGRQQSRSAANSDGGGGRSAGGTKLGRTKPAGSRKSAAAMALVTVTAAPDATKPANDAAHLRSIHGTVQ